MLRASVFANLKRPGDNIGDLSSRLFLSVQFPPLIGLATQVSIAVRLLDRSPTLCSVPGNDWGPGWRQDGQRMVCQTAARWCWTCGGKSPSKQMSKGNTGYRNSKEGCWKGWLNLGRHNWQSAPHLVGKLNLKHLNFQYQVNNNCQDGSEWWFLPPPVVFLHCQAVDQAEAGQ